MNWIGQVAAFLAAIGAIIFYIWRTVARATKTAREAERAAIDAEIERAKVEAHKRMRDARQSAADVDVAEGLRSGSRKP